MEEAENLSDRIGIMKDGNLLFVGAKEELYSKTNKTNVEDAFIEIVSGGSTQWKILYQEYMFSQRETLKKS